jgi:hypothetical protein
MTNRAESLAGKTALITGAARRLGRAIALSLAREGVHVVIHYNRSQTDAESLRREVESLGASAWLAQGDLADPRQTEAVFDQALACAGAVDILVNNASIFREDTVWDAGAESLEENLRIHAVSPLILSRRLAAQERSGRIVNILDTRVTVYDRAHASYHISKRALTSLTRMLAIELAPRVTVNAVAPGLILPPAGQDDTYLERLARANPLKTHGSASDVAEAVLFLVRARFSTGQILFIDGGYHMKGHMYD